MKSIIIHEFMMRDLHLKGVKLLVYAMIYSFSQFGQGCFVSDKVACLFLDISRSQYFVAKKYLIDNELIVCDAKSNSFYCTRSLFERDTYNEELIEAVRIARINVYE